MKKQLLLALSLAGLTSLSAHAQMASCNAAITKSGTGMTRTYNVTSNAISPMYTFSAYASGQGYVATGSTNPFVVTYTQPGYYNVGGSVNGSNCSDSVYVMDTVVGTLNCAALTHSISPSGSGAAFNFYLYGAHNSSFPYYTRTTNYTYGDGTSGSSNSHTYAATGMYLVTATTTFSSSNYGTCSIVDTVSVNAVVGNPSGFNCNNVNAAFGYQVTAATAYFSNNSINTNTTSSTVSYMWDFGDGGTSIASSPNHTYLASGQYCVTLVAQWMGGGVVCTDSVTQCNININIAPPANEINASANWDSSVNAAGATVRFWLINYDSSTQMLTALDSVDVPCTANIPYATTVWTNKPAGQYRVKANMMNQPSSWLVGFLPTYAYNDYYWYSAQVINHTNGTDYGNIMLLQGTTLSGPGFIGGLVTQGANKGTAVGDPIANLTIYLRNAAGAPVASTITNANGSYGFSNLPIGSYSVYPDAITFTTTPSANLIVTATTTQLTGNNFKYEPVQKKIHPVSQSVVNTTVGEVSVFPNPAKDMLTIQFAQAPEKGAVIRLLNLNGQVVHSESATATMQLNVSGLAAGTYLLQVPGANTTYRIAVQK